MNASTDSSQLATRLGFAAEHGRADAYYRLSRIVARVLVSARLKQRPKWRSLAKQLSQNPGVELRLVHQAIRGLNRASAARA
ncbi:MAG: hypothetical protein RIS79_2013 [Verrucomicrobiota bacterium]|jgi:hypothetical protein